MQTVTISTRSHNVRQLFLDLIRLSEEKHSDLHPHVSSSKVADCLERFVLWAGSMEPLSLDQRLLQAADIQGQIIRQLEEIEEAIDECESSTAIVFSHLI